jgi:hypothetical protein
MPEFKCKKCDNKVQIQIIAYKVNGKYVYYQLCNEHEKERWEDYKSFIESNEV